MVCVQVPTAAAVYYEDLYVSQAISEETAAEINGIRVWMTNEFQHSGLRDDGAKVVERLLDMLSGNLPLN